jgi:hypothetical protein
LKQSGYTLSPLLGHKSSSLNDSMIPGNPGRRVSRPPWQILHLLYATMWCCSKERASGLHVKSVGARTITCTFVEFLFLFLSSSFVLIASRLTQDLFFSLTSLVSHSRLPTSSRYHVAAVCAFVLSFFSTHFICLYSLFSNHHH